MAIIRNLASAYKAHIISTIVDITSASEFQRAYKAHIISTIVDMMI